MANILITGATRGIGHSLYDAYNARGENVTGTYRGTAPSTGTWAQLDVTDPASANALCAAYEPANLDLLVCNAGVYLDKGQNLASGYPAQMWHDTFAANVAGVFLTIQSMLPKLQASKSAKIVIVSSLMASNSRAPGGSYIYRASKAAVLNLGRNLASDLAPLNIAVGIYHPGWVQTDMGGPAADITTDEAVAGLMARFDALSLQTTGIFEGWDGQPIPY